MRKCFLILFLIIYSFAGKSQSPLYEADAVHHPVLSTNGMVASQHALASEVGVQILKDGGNAVDAAVAVGFALAVVLPRAGNIGGGGFMMVYMASKDLTTTIDYRERAPEASSRDMFLDIDGKVDDEKFNNSYLSIGVPGSVAGMIYALEKYGTMSLQEVLKPAILLADKGFEVTYDLAQILRTYEDRLKRCPSTKSIFYKGADFYEAGDILVQKDLAWSLKQISKHGLQAFYKGALGEKLVAAISKNGGIMTMADLNNYQVKEMDPVWGTYRGYQIASMPPPSSGGVHILQMLNILEDFPLSYLAHNSAETLHLMAETMRLAYADRSEHLGDPAFWKVPVNGLISKEYAETLRIKIKREQANLSDDIRHGNPSDYESEETTHYSVVDRYGNAVSNTYTLNFSFGTGLVAEGTGILLNNEMGDFSAKPGTANAYGLVGGEANAVEASKTPLSSMTPTMVFDKGRPYIITGSPGGSRIITTVLQIILNVIDFDMNIAEATHAPRIHHQWYPDVLYYERGLSYDTRSLLACKGHKMAQRPAMGSTQSLMVKDGVIYGSSDPRRPDGFTVGY